MTDHKRRFREWYRVRTSSIGVASLLVVLTLAPAAAQEPEEPSAWRYDATLYAWLAGLSGDIGVGQTGQEVDASFEDLASLLDFAMAGHFEARNEIVVLVGDLSYVGLGAEREGKIANQPVDVDLDLDQWIVEVGGGWRASEEFDVLLVGRYYILDLGSTAESIAGTAAGGSSEDWGDVFIGVRYSRHFSEKWLFSVRGDVGGGGSDFAWFGNVALGYQFSELFSTLASWRVLSVDRAGDSADEYFKYDVTQSGLGIGARFSF